MPEIAVARIGPDTAHALAPLLAAYVQEVRGGGPPRPDQYYAERLLEDPGVEIVGARFGGELVGFALFHVLPDFFSGLDRGLLEGLYVRCDRRRRGIGRALVEHLAAEGGRRGWIHLRWLVDENAADSTLPECIAHPAPWRSYVIDIARS